MKHVFLFYSDYDCLNFIKVARCHPSAALEVCTLEHQKENIFKRKPFHSLKRGGSERRDTYCGQYERIIYFAGVR